MDSSIPALKSNHNATRHSKTENIHKVIIFLTGARDYPKKLEWGIPSPSGEELTHCPDVLNG